MTRKHSTLVTAFTFAAVALVGASMAQASMTINLRLAAAAGGGTVRQLTAADVGANLQVEVWVAVTNTVDPPGTVNGTGEHEGLGFLAYSVVSHKNAPLLGVDGDIASPLNKLPFRGLGNQPGAIADLNPLEDNIGDLGSLADNSTTDVVRPRSPGARYDDAGGVDIVVIPGGSEFRVATFNFHVNAVGAGGPDGGVTYNPVIPAWILGAVPGANWWQDADYDISPNNGLNNNIYLAGAGVTFIGLVPEPGTLALLGLSLVGLVGYVRNRKHRD